MQKILFAFTLYLLLFTTANAQNDIHTIAEILELIEKSKTMYEIGIIEDEIPCTDQTKNLNTLYSYQVKKGESYDMGTYQMSEDMEKVFMEAEAFIEQKEPIKAREKYEQVLKVYPKNSMIITYIGQTYEMENDNSTALNFYKKAVEMNYFNYMARWFMADIYYSHKKYKEAKEQVTTALILNRNNPRLKGAVKRIYKADYTPYFDWCFEPQMVLSKKDSVVQINLSMSWMGYAMSKALWKYEPGYKRQMTGGDGYTTLEERECLLALYMGMMSDDEKKWENFEPLRYLNYAVDNKLLEMYMLFEVTLPLYPQAVYSLTQQNIEDIKDYVIKVHTQKI